MALSRTLFFVALIISVFGCQRDIQSPNQTTKNETANVNFHFSKPASIDSLVVFAHVFVTAPDMDTILTELSVYSDKVEGMIENIPAGPNRKFEVFTYDSNMNITYSGSTTSDILANQTITLQIVLYPTNNTGSVVIVGTFANYPPTTEQALKFDGSNDYVTFPSPLINTKYFTIEAWINMEEKSSSIYSQNIIFQQRSDHEIFGNNNNEIVFASEGTNPEAVFSLRSTIGPIQNIRAPLQSYNEWHHYAIVVSETQIILYIDGFLAGSLPNLQQGLYNSYIDYTELGRHRYSNQDAGFLNGQMDEVRIWNIPRTQNDIQNSMNTHLQGNEPGLAGYWPLDASSGQVVPDATGYMNGYLGSTPNSDLNDPVWINTAFPHN